MTFPTDGNGRQRQPEWRRVRFVEPDVPSITEIPEVITAAAEFELRLSPAKASRVGVAIQKLLLHYPVKEMTPKMNKLVAEDWLDDLCQFPSWAVEMACREWRQTQKWRPTVSELIRICNRIVWPYKYQLDRMKKMIRQAEDRLRDDEIWRERVNEMKADGSWEVMKAKFLGRIK